MKRSMYPFFLIVRDFQGFLDPEELICPLKFLSGIKISIHLKKKDRKRKVKSTAFSVAVE